MGKITSKELLKDHIFLAGILKAVVSEYKNVSEQDIVSKYIEPESILLADPVILKRTSDG